MNDPKLLAQDGWTPSEGNPQFHQQMVYAVAMTTILHFEQALGRRSLWAPHFPKDSAGSDGSDNIECVEVPRLRLYPHALRTENAYYSPDKMAILFGYFPAQSENGDATPPGSMVFTSLSSDIIAHETTHALLDGLHRRFQEASNIDVPAFHEGFADIVALFQHFTITELVRHEISRLRGNLFEEGLLGGMARQFGEGIAKRGPLRNYTKADPENLRYSKLEEAHERGSILVYGVYDAFRHIVELRTADLIRLATGGRGVLPAGDIHPDLVERVTIETCKTAKHVLHICIRALDYCPPVDITFGDYLRALITADLDVAKDDRRFGYRVAFIEAFRTWGIFPGGVRTFSEETLAWNTLEEPKPKWLKSAIKVIDINWNVDPSRSKIFELNNRNRKSLFVVLTTLFEKNPDLYEQFGLKAGVPKFKADGTIDEERLAPRSTFGVHNVRRVRRTALDGTYRGEIVVSITQRQAIPYDGKNVANGFFWFRGGATLILDPRAGEESIRYSIVKNSGSESRCERQKKLLGLNMLSPLRALYFGGDTNNGNGATEPFAMMHAGHGEFGDD